MDFIRSVDKLFLYLHTVFFFFLNKCVLLWTIRSDCVDILTQCGDRKRFREGQTPERICDLLSPTDDPERCIPLERYLSMYYKDCLYSRGLFSYLNMKHKNQKQLSAQNQEILRNCKVKTTIKLNNLYIQIVHMHTNQHVLTNMFTWICLLSVVNVILKEMVLLLF